MKTSETVVNISKAMIEAHKKIGHATKDSKNPHFKNDYASLESVINASKESLLEQNVFVIQSVNEKRITTRLQHVSGEFFESSLDLILSKQDMQGLGSAITYARRYSLASMLNISQADDDGHEASKPDPKPQDKKPFVERTTKPIQKEYDFENYVIQFGKKMAGKKLTDFTVTDHEGMLRYLEDGAAKTGKELSGAALEYYNIAVAYVKSMGAPKVDTDEVFPF